MQPLDPNRGVRVPEHDGLHGHDSADARKSIGHHADHRAATQPDDRRGIDTLEQAAVSTGVLPRRTTCLGRRTARAGLTARIWPINQPVEQQTDRREVQFDGRLGRRRLQSLYIVRDVDRLDVGKLADAVLLDPGKEEARGTVIGHARVLIADRGGEKFDEAAREMRARPKNRLADRRIGDRSCGVTYHTADPFAGEWIDERTAPSGRSRTRPCGR
jgi:hypothetical protein